MGSAHRRRYLINAIGIQTIIAAFGIAGLCAAK
jgi:hypothetical protein